MRSFTLFVAVLVVVPSRADDEAFLRDRGIAADAAGLKDYFKKRSPTPEDRATIESLVRDLGSRSFRKRRTASESLTAWGSASLEPLRRVLKDPDIEIVRRAERVIADIESTGTELTQAAIRRLVRLAPPDAAAILLDYIPHADDPVLVDLVLESLPPLTKKSTAGDKAIREAIRDAVARRRLAAGYVLGRAADPAARILLKDADLAVRFRTAEAFLFGRDRTAVQPLIEMLVSVDPETRWRIEDLLSRLPDCVKGGAAPPDSTDGDDAQALRRRRDRWSAWWTKHGDAVDLARIEERPPWLNLTLVPEMHAHKIWEFGPDGKVRWEITRDLRCPIDAQVLPSGRVLVAELDGHRVTERDREGRILWQHDVQTPIYARRMPDGNTFIATNNAYFIVTPAKKEVLRYESGEGYFIHSIQQMPNRHVVAISMEGDVREMGSDGKLIRTIALKERGSWSGIEGLPGNRFLCVSTGKLREIDATGRIVWRLDYPGACYATRLPNGNTLIVDNNRGLAEVDRDGKVIATKSMKTSVWRAHRR